jgi:amino acid transporter
MAFAGIPLAGRQTMLVSLFAITGIVVWSTRKGVDTSVRTAVILMIIESSVVVALALTILAVKLPQSSGMLFGPFNLRQASGGLGGFWRALIMGVLAFAGFDVVSTAAEETLAPHRQIPRATLLTVLGTGTFWVLCSWIYTLAVPPAAVEQYTHQGMTAVTPLARIYWGGGSLLIVLTALTGVIAIFISSVLATSRLIFALARHGLLPHRCADLHPIHRVPSNAMRLVFLIVVLCNVITIAVTSNGVAGFVWWSNTMVFFLTLTFAGVNLANFLYFRRVVAQRFRWHLNLLVPALGLGANICLLYEAFFRTLLISNSGAARSAVIFCLAVLCVWCACALIVRRIAPHRLRGAPPIAVSRCVKSEFPDEQVSEA